MKLPNPLKKAVRDPSGPFHKRVVKDRTKYNRKKKHKGKTFEEFTREQINEEPLLTLGGMVLGAAAIEGIAQLIKLAKKATSSK